MEVLEKKKKQKFSFWSSLFSLSLKNKKYAPNVVDSTDGSKKFYHSFRHKPRKDTDSVINSNVDTFTTFEGYELQNIHNKSGILFVGNMHNQSESYKSKKKHVQFAPTPLNKYYRIAQQNDDFSSYENKENVNPSKLSAASSLVPKYHKSEKFSTEFIRSALLDENESPCLKGSCRDDVKRTPFPRTSTRSVLCDQKNLSLPRLNISSVMNDQPNVPSNNYGSLKIKKVDRNNVPLTYRHSQQYYFYPSEGHCEDYSQYVKANNYSIEPQKSVANVQKSSVHKKTDESVHKPKSDIVTKDNHSVLNNYMGKHCLAVKTMAGVQPLRSSDEERISVYKKSSLLQKSTAHKKEVRNSVPLEVEKYNKQSFSAPFGDGFHCFNTEKRKCAECETCNNCNCVFSELLSETKTNKVVAMHPIHSCALQNQHRSLKRNHSEKYYKLNNHTSNPVSFRNHLSVNSIVNAQSTEICKCNTHENSNTYKYYFQDYYYPEKLKESINVSNLKKEKEPLDRNCKIPTYFNDDCMSTLADDELSLNCSCIGCMPDLDSVEKTDFSVEKQKSSTERFVFWNTDNQRTETQKEMREQRNSKRISSDSDIKKRYPNSLGDNSLHTFSIQKHSLCNEITLTKENKKISILERNISSEKSNVPSKKNDFFKHNAVSNFQCICKSNMSRNVVTCNKKFDNNDTHKLAVENDTISKSEIRFPIGESFELNNEIHSNGSLNNNQPENIYENVTEVKKLIPITDCQNKCFSTQNVIKSNEIKGNLHVSEENHVDNKSVSSIKTADNEKQQGIFKKSECLLKHSVSLSSFFIENDRKAQNIILNKKYSLSLPGLKFDCTVVKTSNVVNNCTKRQPIYVPQPVKDELQKKYENGKKSHPSDVKMEKSASNKIDPDSAASYCSNASKDSCSENETLLLEEVKKLSMSFSSKMKSNGSVSRPLYKHKFKAKDVLSGKAKLKLSIYHNSGLVTIHVIKALKLSSLRTLNLNPYVKVSLQPDETRRAHWRTNVVQNQCNPIFNQKFSFEVVPEDASKRLIFSVWHRDIIKKRSEFLGCMSFGVHHVMNELHNLNGWYRLLKEVVGIQKHFAARTTKAESMKR